MFKAYPSIKNYLERFNILSIGRFKIRLHKIINADGTPYLHNHPFSFISFIIKGSYTEQLLIDNKIIETTFKTGAIIIRKSNQYHRIKSANNCKTIFFSFYNKKGWDLKTHPDINENNFLCPDVTGIYKRIINNKEYYCKFDKYWFIGSQIIEKAIEENRLSIYQTEKWNELIKII